MQDQPILILASRFWARVDKNGPIPELRPDLGPCWIWTGSVNHQGYGHITAGRRGFLVHRITYVWNIGPIESGLELDHLCRIHACVNPYHLEPVTHAENMRRSAIYRLEICAYRVSLAATTEPLSIGVALGFPP